MPKFAFNMRQTIEKTVWVEADSLPDAIARVDWARKNRTGPSEDCDDDTLLALTFRRQPERDEP